jgi:competence protein ComEC
MVVLLLPLVAAILLLNRFCPSLLLCQTEYEPLDSLQTYRFVLSSEPRDTKKCRRFETQERVLLYILRDSTAACPQPGDTIIARTRIRRGGTTGTFDYGTYLRRQGIIGTAFVRPPYQRRPSSLPPKGMPLRQRLYHRLADAGLSGDELALAGALTLGYKEDLDPALKRHFQASGAAHVLAVSGLHTGIIYAFLICLLTLGGRFRPRYENRLGRTLISLVLIAVMWFYAWLTGMTPSVVRAVTMVTVFEVGRILYRRAFSLNTVAAAAVLILLVRPLDLWSVSFQLSFAATFAIIFFAQYAERFLHLKKWKNRWVGRLCNWLVGTVIFSLAAQLGTLPLTMYYFGQTSTFFLLTNLIVLPLATFLVPCGLISIALGGTAAGVLFSKMTFALAWLMNHATGWIEHLPGSSFPAHADTGMVLLYYVLLALFLLFLPKKNA